MGPVIRTKFSKFNQTQYRNDVQKDLLYSIFQGKPGKIRNSSAKDKPIFP